MFHFKILKCNYIYLDSVWRHAFIYLDATIGNLAQHLPVMCIS